MFVPKIKLRLTGSASKTKHTLKEMEACYEYTASLSGMEIYSVEKDCKSIKPKGSKYYIVEVNGYCYDGTCADSKTNEIWYHRPELPFYINFKFDVKSAILFHAITMRTAIRDFGFVLNKNDENYFDLYQAYDYSKYLLNLTKDQRYNHSTFLYNFQKQLRECA